MATEGREIPAHPALAQKYGRRSVGLAAGLIGGLLIGMIWGRRASVLTSPAELSIPPLEEDIMLKKFRDFAIKGNVVDLAIGVIIGAAFGKIVESMVGDIFMPVIGALTGGLDFSNYFIGLSRMVSADTLLEAKKQGAVLAWGNFVTVIINFLIIAATLFIVVNLIQKIRQREEEKSAAAPPRQEVLLQEIRDLLAKK
jgi:large conductance mechanosensitive channel